MFPPAPYLPGISAPAAREHARAFLEAALGDTSVATQTARQPELLEDHPAWRFGVRLFQRSYFWEAHEAWEKLWSRLPPDCAERELLHVLLQWSASLLLFRCGRQSGASRVARRAAERAESLLRKGVRCLLGVDVQRLAARIRKYSKELDQARALPAHNDPMRVALPLVRKR